MIAVPFFMIIKIIPTKKGAVKKQPKKKTDYKLTER